MCVFYIFVRELFIRLGNYDVTVEATPWLLKCDKIILVVTR